MRSITAVCALVLAVSAAVAQSDPPAPPEKLGEWPALDAPTKDRVLALAGQFKKQDPKLHESASKQLVEIGAGAAPLLMQQVSDRAENQNELLFAVFDQVLDRSHSALMAREVKKPRAALRRYLTRRLCEFVEPELLPVLKVAAADKDEQTAFLGALGALALKQRDGVAPVMAHCRHHWAEAAELVAKVLPAARSHEVGEWLWESIAQASPVDQMTGLRLLRYVATREQAMLLKRYLEASDHTVKREAINTARVLHGEPPVENLSVFQAIEQSKQWLQKL